ncbi:hypothetical protein HY041_03115 [Candidatus Roizmanbacteria bacterium]|nr:hypothetical protein [Candidatus Roizmanbacteria bacterium]
MKKLIQYGIWIILPTLILANMFVFVSGIVLGDQIGHFEQETKKVHEQNVALEQKTSHLDSLEYAASIAASLDFVKRSTPIVLENLKYAFNH